MSRPPVDDETKEAKPTERRRSEPVPGLVVVHTDGKPVSRLILAGAKPIALGRGADADVALPHDTELSRRHASVSFDGSVWRIKDLGSRNGTFVDGARIDGEVVVEHPRVLRVGLTCLCLERDASRLATATAKTVEDRVIGPGVEAAEHQVGAAAARGDTVLIMGESGVGKDLLAHSYHAKSVRNRGPFVHVNVGAISKSTAAGELFGAKRGAYSGAHSDRRGLITSAEGGVLFLDEIALLDLELQGALLTAIETKKIFPVGSSEARKVDVLFCFATNVDLEEAVERGTFRGDLLMRISQAAVRVPPLRERREEIPFLIELALQNYSAKTGHILTPTAQFVEACLLRPWSVGNIRELNNALTAACDSALRAKSTELTPEDLPKVREASRQQNSVPPPATTSSLPASAIPPFIDVPRDLKKAAFVKAYRELNGDVVAAAKKAGISRSSGYIYLAELRGEGGDPKDK